MTGPDILVWMAAVMIAVNLCVLIWFILLIQGTYRLRRLLWEICLGAQSLRQNAVVIYQLTRILTDYRRRLERGELGDRL